MESVKNKAAGAYRGHGSGERNRLEMKKALLRGDLDRFGDMLHEGWIQKKKMAKGITTPRIDELYEGSAQSRGHRTQNHRGRGWRSF